MLAISFISILLTIGTYVDEQLVFSFFWFEMCADGGRWRPFEWRQRPPLNKQKQNGFLLDNLIR